MDKVSRRNRLLSVLIVTVAVGIALWLYRVPILLGLVGFQSDRQYLDRKPFYQVPWGSGPMIRNTADPAANKPNVILIVADDLGFNDISTFGGGVAGGRVKTPNIDALAAQGALFKQSYSGASTCAPSRAMMMTGRYPSRTGFVSTPTPAFMGRMVKLISGSIDNNLPPMEVDTELAASKPPYEEQGLPTDETTVAELLKQQGYYTAHIGKWHLGRANGMAPQQQGFEDSLLMHSGLYLPVDAPDVVNAKLEFDPIDKFLWAAARYSASFNEEISSSGFYPGGYLTDYYTDESLRVIEANTNRPFFLYLAHWGVHTPLQATRADFDAVGEIKPHRLRVYAAMIRALDRSVGRIVEKLRQEGLEENTIVIFTSDNGGPGYLGLSDVNYPYRGWKLTSFEGGLRVPMMIKWPAQIEPGTTVDSPVAHIDLLPTISAAANVSLPPGREVDGQDLLPLMDSKQNHKWNRETLFWVNDHSQVVRHGDWKLQLNRHPQKGLQRWLHNLSQDPSEKVNLINSQPEKAAELEALLKEYQENARTPLYPVTTQIPIVIDKTLAEKFEPEDPLVYTPN